MTTTRHARLRGFTRWLPSLLWAAVIFAGSSIPGSRLPGGYSVWGHLVEYAILGALVVSAQDRTRDPRTFALVALAICALYGLSDEAHQAFVPLRTPDPLDWATDVIGSGAGIVAVLALRGLSRDQ